MPGAAKTTGEGGPFRASLWLGGGGTVSVRAPPASECIVGGWPCFPWPLSPCVGVGDPIRSRVRVPRHLLLLSTPSHLPLPPAARWEIIRRGGSVVPPAAFPLFNLVFIALYQNLLLLMILLPMYVCWRHAGEPLNIGDAVAAGGAALFLALETAADEQQWAFQVRFAGCGRLMMEGTGVRGWRCRACEPTKRDVAGLGSDRTAGGAGPRAAATASTARGADPAATACISPGPLTMPLPGGQVRAQGDGPAADRRFRQGVPDIGTLSLQPPPKLLRRCSSAGAVHCQGGVCR